MAQKGQVELNQFCLSTTGINNTGRSADQILPSPIKLVQMGEDPQRDLGMQRETGLRYPLAMVLFKFYGCKMEMQISVQVSKTS